MSVAPMKALELAGLDGANPLGFLAALGTLVTVHTAGEVDARLAWRRGQTWMPVVTNVSANAHVAFSESVAKALQGGDVSRDADQRRATAAKRYEAAKKAAGDKRREISRRRVKAKERDAAIETELRPLEIDREQKKGEWLQALAAAVPRQELALGKRIDCTPEEYRRHALAFQGSSSLDEREPIDLLASFGSDACVDVRSDSIEPTPFCFIRGSGHQYFLDTVRQLMEHVSIEGVQRVLFAPWDYTESGLSMRWDPLEDRRYALMDADPGPMGARTVWMANLLAYRSLALFPAAPRQRGLEATAWTRSGQEPVFTWPIWESFLSIETIRSLLQLRELTVDAPPASDLRARGVAAVFRARRIKVGVGANFKLNFSPARAVL